MAMNEGMFLQTAKAPLRSVALISTLGYPEGFRRPSWIAEHMEKIISETSNSGSRRPIGLQSGVIQPRCWLGIGSFVFVERLDIVSLKEKKQRLVVDRAWF